MLAFGIRYLNGFVAARAAPDDQKAEWPPHPGRVFMALAAAHFQTGADLCERKALLWLEALEDGGEPVAPLIVASDALHRSVVTHFVPVNDKNDGYKIKPGKITKFQEIGATGIRRDRHERTFTRAWLIDDKVFLVWPNVKPDDETRAALDALCGKVTRIGHSSSLVQMWLASEDEIGKPTWTPNEERADIHLRVAVRGSLEHLEQCFNAQAVETFAHLKTIAGDASDRRARREAKRRLRDEFGNDPPVRLRPSLSISCGYARPVQPDTGFVAAGSIFSPHLIVRTLDRSEGPFRHLDLASTLVLTQRWREALLSHSNDLSPEVRAVLSGHNADGTPLKDAHLTFIPLAFVDHEHADGHLLGMGFALPGNLSREDRRGVQEAIGRIREIKLGRLGVWNVKAMTALSPAPSLQAQTWTAYPKGATMWSTITPIAFDHHPHSKKKADYLTNVAKMIEECCSYTGLPKPTKIIPTPVSAHIGAPPAHAFPRLQRKEGGLRRHTHALLIFDEPVCGPVILGAGRYRGYGVCRPINAAHREAMT
jgi:CRISPR-associated protein Csb2